MDPTTCEIATNSDIAAIGVRVSFYVQGLLGIIATYVVHPDDVFPTMLNGLLGSAALTLTAFIRIKSISVVDALLVTFLPLTIAVGAGNFSVLVLSKRLFWSTAGLVGMSSIFGLYLWTKVHTLGATTECNLNSRVIFVAFGHSIFIGHSGPLRVFALLFFSAGLLLIPVAICVFGCLSERRERMMTGELAEVLYRWERGPRILPIVQLPFLLGIWIYAIVTIEQIISRNALNHQTTTWTFGQTLTMFLLVPSIWALVDGGRSFSEKRADEEEREMRRYQKRNAPDIETPLPDKEETEPVTATSQEEASPPSHVSDGIAEVPKNDI